jgi:hypothetical protein
MNIDADHVTVERTIYPDQHYCINPLCANAINSLPLKKEQQRRVVIYTVADGACAAWSVHVYCARKSSLV